MKKAAIYLIATWVMLSSIVVNLSANSTDVSSPSKNSIVLVQGKETPIIKKLPKGGPEIVFLDFTRRGDSAIIFWEVKYAGKITIGKADPQDIHKVLNARKVERTGSLRVTPTETTTYRLIAQSSKSHTSVIRQVKIEVEGSSSNVSDLPEIISFKISPTTVKAGGEITLYWQVKNAESVRLYEDGKEWKSKNRLPNGKFGWELSNPWAVATSLNKTSTFELVAKNREGKTTRRKLTAKVAGTVKVERTVPLKLYWSPKRTDNFTTATTKGEEAAKAGGYKFLRIMGYIRTP